MAEIKGGNKLVDKLKVLAEHIASARAVRIGWLSGATYPDGTPVALVAAIDEFGAPSRGQPARPAFRNMIATKKAEWPAAIATALKDNDLDAAKALATVGAGVKGQLQQSIADISSPPLKPATVKRKGFDKPWIDSGHALNSVDYEVKI